MGSNERQGMISLFRNGEINMSSKDSLYISNDCVNFSEQHPILRNYDVHVMLTDGEFTYCGCLDVDDITIQKQPENIIDDRNYNSSFLVEREQAIVTMTNYILQDISNITTSYVLLQCDYNEYPEKKLTHNNNSVKMVVKEVKGRFSCKLWSGYLTLPLIDDNRQATAHHYIRCLTKCVNMYHEDAVRLRYVIQNIESERNEWKNTVFKLENSWQDEKDELIDRFLKILNRFKSLNVRSREFNGEQLLK